MYSVSLGMTNPLKGLVRVTYIYFKFWCSHHIFGISEARYYICRVLLDTEEY